MKIVEWNVKSDDKARREQLIKKHNIDNLTATILANRGLNDDEVDSLLNEKELEDPLSLKDMDNAVSIIREAVGKGEKIAIYGDYDCDGILASTILYQYLISIGANVLVYIPERNEGYGVTKVGIDNIKEQGANLIITVDNGITAIEEAEYIYNQKMKLIITDHHKPGDNLPKAEAIVNPQRKDCGSKFKEICGCVVAFKLIVAMEDGDYETVFDFAGDLAAIATVGDIMPLNFENRDIVKRGLSLIKTTQNKGLKALIESLNIKDDLSASKLAFLICPRINAAGRLNDANLAFSLLNIEDDEKIEEIVKKIEEYNLKRKELEDRVVKDIKQIIKEDKIKLRKRILIFKGDNWDKGVIGIIAGKIANHYGKPTIILTKEDDEYIGSARSIKDYSIYDALKSVEDLLTKWGGHKLAGGLSFKAENYDRFLNRIDKYSSENPPVHDNLEIDAILKDDDISLKNADNLKQLEPFGHSNKKPRFLIEGAIIKNVYSLSNGNHVKFEVIFSGQTLNVLYFNHKYSSFVYKKGDKVDIVLTLEINNFLNEKKVDCFCVAIKDHDINLKELVEQFDNYEKFIREESVNKETIKNSTPTRDDFKVVYQKIKELDGFYGDIVDFYRVVYKSGINLFKLMIIFDVLENNNLINISKDKIEAVKNPKKVNLFDDKLLKTVIANGNG